MYIYFKNFIKYDREYYNYKLVDRYKFESCLSANIKLNDTFSK